MTVLTPTAKPDLFADVGEFHAKFGLATHRTVKPALLPPDVLKFRSDFHMEEATEFHDAHVEQDTAKAADALVDLVYVALGSAHMMGIDFNAHWALVHGKNMQKERATGAGDDRSKRSHSLDVVKPAGWTPPDHAPILAATARDWSYTNERTDAE